MEKSNKLIANSTVVSFIVYASLYLFVYYSSSSNFMGKSASFLCLSCVVFYFLCTKLKFLTSSTFSNIAFYLSLSLGIGLLFFSRKSNPMILNVEFPLYYLFMFSYFVSLENENNTNQKIFNHSVFTIVFSIILILFPDINGLILFNTFTLLYGIICLKNSLIKSVLINILSLIVCLLIIFNNKSLTNNLIFQLSNSYSNNGIRTFLFDNFGITGVVFAFVILCMMILIMVRDSRSFMFFTYLVTILIFSLISEKYGRYNVSFFFLPNTINILFLNILFLGYLNNREKKYA